MDRSRSRLKTAGGVPPVLELCFQLVTSCLILDMATRLWDVAVFKSFHSYLSFKLATREENKVAAKCFRFGDLMGF